jgi:D-beta-D-heptose 7-phosphate kinase/D-beta-D-heptose 1-phosphate adenosyltransferase
MLVTGKECHGDSELAEAMSEVTATYQLQHLLVTRGAHGMCLSSKGRQPQFIPAIAREVYDVSGAGDTVIATLATGIAAEMSFSDAAHMANIAAGVVVGKLGTQPINLLELRAAEGLNTDEVCGTVNTKVHSLAAAVVQVQAWKAVNDKVVFTNGCFDLLHPGHIHLLNEAKRCGHRLIVGLNSDDSVRRIKGPQRPILSDSDRAAILGALDCVDLVVIFDEDTPIKLIDALKPDILVKGADYSIENVVGREIVESNGGRVQLVPVREGYSTTGITEKMSQMGKGNSK